MKNLNLTMADKELITANDWLTDKHINAVNKLLLNQFPNQNGLQDPLLLAAMKQYKSGNTNFVQILNVNRQHWVCVSNKNCPPGEVEIYDSLPNFTKNSFTVRCQVATIMKTKEDSFLMSHVDVQRQIGSNDCALFAIAFAVNLCFGQDPHSVGYAQFSLRDHLLTCLENNKLTPFPTSRSRRLSRNREFNSQTVFVYCVCRQTWERSNSSEPLTQCCSCKEWFHQSCMDIDQKIVDYPFLKYNCKLCLKLL